jgi:hypothetical protein
MFCKWPPIHQAKNTPLNPYTMKFCSATVRHVTVLPPHFLGRICLLSHSVGHASCRRPLGQPPWPQWASCRRTDDVDARMLERSRRLYDTEQSGTDKCWAHCDTHWLAKPPPAKWVGSTAHAATSLPHWLGRRWILGSWDQDSHSNRLPRGGRTCKGHCGRCTRGQGHIDAGEERKHDGGACVTHHMAVWCVSMRCGPNLVCTCARSLTASLVRFSAYGAPTIAGRARPTCHARSLHHLCGSLHTVHRLSLAEPDPRVTLARQMHCCTNFTGPPLALPQRVCFQWYVAHAQGL